MMTGLHYEFDAVREAASSYEHKAKVLRQIHSDKLQRAMRKSFWLTISVICASVFFAFVSIVGEQVRLLLAPGISAAVFQLLNNVAVIVLLIASIVQLGMNLPERISSHLNSVKRLTEFIVDLNDVLRVKQCDAREAESLMREMRSAYKAIIQSLPESSDKDWRKAKQEFQSKTADKAKNRSRDQHHECVVQ